MAMGSSVQGLKAQSGLGECPCVFPGDTAAGRLVPLCLLVRAAGFFPPLRWPICFGEEKTNNVLMTAGTFFLHLSS